MGEMEEMATTRPGDGHLEGYKIESRKNSANKHRGLPCELDPVMINSLPKSKRPCLDNPADSAGNGNGFSYLKGLVTTFIWLFPVVVGSRVQWRSPLSVLKRPHLTMVWRLFSSDKQFIDLISGVGI